MFKSDKLSNLPPTLVCLEGLLPCEVFSTVATTEVRLLPHFVELEHMSVKVSSVDKSVALSAPAPSADLRQVFGSFT